MSRKDTKRTEPAGHGFVEGHESVDAARRPGPGESRKTAERPSAPRDPEGQSSGRSMDEELFLDPRDDDAGPLPHQRAGNSGPAGDTPPRRRGAEPDSRVNQVEKNHDN